MTTYGTFPGVQVTTQAGGITAVEVGDEEKIVIFGEADLGGSAEQGSASVNDPTQIGSRLDAESTFGEDSELTDAMQEALANGANIGFLYGVAVDTTAVTAEAVAASASGSLANAPIVEDLGTITVRDTVDTVDATVEFRYDSSLSTPSDSDTVFINPLTGDWVADSSSDYEFDYEYQEWSAAFGSANNVLNEGETGVYVSLSEAESVVTDLQSEVSTLRDNYKLVSGVAGAQPNATSVDTTAANFDTASYTDAVDDDTQFLAGPVRREDTDRTVLGGIGGLFGGNPINDPVYNDPLSGYTSLEQTLTKTEADELRDEEVIPIRQAGSIRVKDNLSTSTATDWERDFWRRRIVDRVILIAKQVGDDIIGRINTEQTRSVAERTIFNELTDLANDNLIVPNGENEQNFFVDVVQDANDPDQVNINVGITPQGVVKRVDMTVTIDT